MSAMSAFITVKVMVPVDAPLGAALAQKPARMRAGFLRAMAEIGHQQQSGSTAQAAVPVLRASDARVPSPVRDGTSIPEPQEGIALRRAW